MTQPPDPRQPSLQDEELALQRVLRALPAAEPSAKLDAAILAAASDAVAVGKAGAGSGDRRASGGARKAALLFGGLPTWAIGTAAAAVLAVGLGVQLRPPSAARLPEGRPVPATRETPAETAAFELVEPTPRPIRPTAPPPPRQEAPAAAPAAARATTPPPPPPPPPPPAAAVAAQPVVETPAPVPVEELADVAPAAAGTEADAAERLRQQVAEAERERARDAFSRSAAERNARDAARRAHARRMTGSGSRDDGSDAAEITAAPAPSALPPVAEDAVLTPEAWIERIRERLRRGDRHGAVNSLAEFRRVHPGHELPEDLARLR